MHFGSLVISFKSIIDITKNHHFTLVYSMFVCLTIIYLILIFISYYRVLGLLLSNLSYIDLSKFWVPFSHWIVIKLTIYKNVDHTLTTCTHNYPFDTETRPSLSFPIVHEFYQFSLILKTLGTCIAFTFKNQSLFIKVITFRKVNQWINFFRFCHLN